MQQALGASAIMLNSKANNSKFALNNNIATLRQIAVKTAIYLTDAALLLILTYGSEIWALNATLDHNKWDQTSTEQAHLNFIKHILGVDNYYLLTGCKGSYQEIQAQGFSYSPSLRGLFGKPRACISWYGTSTQLVNSLLCDPFWHDN